MVFMKRIGTKLVVASGLLLMSLGFVVAAVTATDSPYWGPVIIAMALMAAGLGLTTGPATEAIMGALPAGKAGAGSAVNDATREVGGTLGVAIVGSVLNSAYGSHVFHGLVALGAPASVGRLAGQSVVAGVTAASRLPLPLRDAAETAVRTAFMAGLHRGSVVAAGTAAVAALVALAFLPARAAAAAGGTGSAGGVGDAASGENSSIARTGPADSARAATPVQA
jgi:MFS transporter, DHA2 family, multidrug resistance protein